MSMAVKPKQIPLESFLLFRATFTVRAGVTHVGVVRCAHCERLNHVEAHVAEASEKCPSKHFAGKTYPIDTYGREKKPAAPIANKSNTPQAALALDEPLPFNDPLPEVTDATNT